jgi:hypothetical protein
MAILYRHIRLDKNEPFYIGIGRDEKRAYSRYGRNSHWKNIVKISKYDVEIIFSDLSWEDAQEKEKEFIRVYGRKDLGLGTLCNLTDGGENPPLLYGHKFNLGRKQSDSTRQKRSRSLKGRTFSDETKKLKSEIAKSKNQKPTQPIGFKHSSETKKNLSEMKKGKKLSKEHCEKLSNVLKGRIFSEEHKLRLSLAAKNRKK